MKFLIENDSLANKNSKNGKSLEFFMIICWKQSLTFLAQIGSRYVRISSFTAPLWISLHDKLHIQVLWLYSSDGTHNSWLSTSWQKYPKLPSLAGIPIKFWQDRELNWFNTFNKTRLIKLIHWIRFYIPDKNSKIFDLYQDITSFVWKAYFLCLQFT